MKSNHLALACLLVAVFCLFTNELRGDEDGSKQGIKTSDIAALKWRSIGPALMSGRIADVAVDAEQPNTWYVAAGSGNVWKTVNAGTTWEAIFDDYGSYSIGCLTIDPSNRHTIWVGTGENVGGRHIGFGDGIYVSRNGGKSFENMGLEDSEHLSKIIVHPDDSDTVYVASQGPLWSSGGDRGLYKTQDGGKTWNCVLSKGEWTGVTDVAMDPKDSETLYAVTHQRHRTVWGLVNGGPESGVFKSTDGGENWTELTTGLPGADKGKMSIAVSPQKSNVVYVTIELANRSGGIWRSEDYGASWKKMSDYVGGGTGPHYYQELYCDPHRFDVLYHANVSLGRSMDGGTTWDSVASNNKHVDNHAVTFHPTDPDFLLVGCDGGLYKSFDFAKTYQFTANLPLTQFYKVAVSYEEPFYHVAGGTQDNYSQYGPSRTRDASGIRNADWRITVGGDGHDCAIDPENPDIIYGESQQGFIRRFDRRTGEVVDIKPQPEAGEEDLRHNWDSPIEISPHLNTRIYFGSKKLHRSDDRGDSWTTISPDLSRNINRFSLPFMGRVWSIDALYDLYAMSQYGNITSIDESPLVEGLIYVGTDDGLIQVTEDGGENWRKIDRIFDVPERFFVNDIKADRHDPDTVYVVVDDHKTGDYQPYVLVSKDRGRTWESMVGDLPKRHICWRIIQDHVNPKLLFLGTEFGAFCTVDAGEHWFKLPGAPTIPFRDLEIQRDENDLVGATFGRGFYVLDDYSALRDVSPDAFNDDGEFKLFPTRPAKLFIEDSVLGGRKGYQGDSYFTADNPPFGAVFTYYLHEDLKSDKQKRTEKEKELAKAGKDNPIPDWEALRMEELSEAPATIFTIRTMEGMVVDRVEGATSKGLHRVVWELRYGGSRFGPLVTPGTYTVEVAQRVDEKETILSPPVEFEVKAALAPALERQDREQTLEFQLAVSDFQAQVMATARKLGGALEDLDSIKSAVKSSRNASPELYGLARKIELALKQLDVRMSGDEVKQSRSQVTQLAILDRVQNALFGTLNQTYGPTKTHRASLEIASREHDELLSELNQIRDGDMADLFEQLEDAKIPWSSGRPW